MVEEMTDDAAVEENERCEDGQCSLWRNVRMVDATVEEDAIMDNAASGGM